MPTKLVTRNPAKLTKKGKSAYKKSIIVGKIKEQWIARQVKQKDRHKWSGWLSPSAFIKLNMCIEEFFEEQIHKPFDPPDDRLMIINTGTLIHTGFMDAMKWIDGMRYSEQPNYLDPEFPIWCKKTGWKGKIDMIMEHESRPAVVDLKNTFMDPYIWRNQKWHEPMEMHHLGQLCVYANRVNASGMFTKKVHKVCILQINWMEKPFSKFFAKEIWIDYWGEYRERTNAFVNAAALGWRQQLDGKRIRCTNDYCLTHGIN
jgi:hypothetical protein